jgi:hypothetical protein
MAGTQYGAKPLVEMGSRTPFTQASSSTHLLSLKRQGSLSSQPSPDFHRSSFLSEKLILL